MGTCLDWRQAGGGVVRTLQSQAQAFLEPEAALYLLTPPSPGCQKLGEGTPGRGPQAGSPGRSHKGIVLRAPRLDSREVLVMLFTDRKPLASNPLLSS